MQSLLLREILLVSHNDRRARKIRFHPRATLIRGANDTGKSSIIKSIFHAFGAEPRNILSRWKRANISYLVRFTVDEKHYSIYRHGDSFSLFSGNTKLLGTFGSVTRELGPRLASLFHLKLQLVDQQGEIRTPPPAYFFLPFYIDQDAGWINNWDSFERLGQFRRWRKDVVYYHTGLHPDKWYEFKAAERIQEKEKQEPINRERVLKDVMKRLQEQLSSARFDVDWQSYKREIDQLLRECAGLREKEEGYKLKLVDLETERIRLEAQKEIVAQAKIELGADYDFATELEHDHVECPTCGASYSNSFAERFAIACDEDRCVSLLQRIGGNLGDLQDRISRHRQSLSSTTLELQKVETLLAARQGEITLQDLIENEGKRAVAKTLNNNLNEVQQEIAKIDTELRQIQLELSKITDRERTLMINKEYLDRMRRYLSFLNVTTLEEPSFKRIDTSIRESGSDLPRAILAYMYSILHVIRSFGSSLFCPIVIDAPRQQEQDRANLERMLEFIRDQRPEGSQLILGLVDDCGIDFGGDVVEMTEKHFALLESEYKAGTEEMAPYSEANLGL